MDLLLMESGGRQKHQQSETQEGGEALPAADGPQLSSGCRTQKRWSETARRGPHAAAARPLSAQTLLTAVRTGWGRAGAADGTRTEAAERAVL